ncbi:hypothetical protein [Pseudescherichia sp.]|uniref:hypothetical protein n=1 Tax=Pseudescherichia sp. TaxID=2055881 RepID=UPI0028A74930|nr:hypothetical protein [Pseudescherichia sp.]
MSEVEIALKVQHFYFTLIVALYLHNKSVLLPNDKAKRRFLLNWLERAKARKLFNRVVREEIDWLVLDLQTVTMQGIESRLLYIHQEIGKLIEAEEAADLPESAFS